MILKFQLRASEVNFFVAIETKISTIRVNVKEIGYNCQVKYKFKYLLTNGGGFILQILDCFLPVGCCLYL